MDGLFILLEFYIILWLTGPCREPLRDTQYPAFLKLMTAAINKASVFHGQSLPASKTVNISVEISAQVSVQDVNYDVHDDS